MECFNCHTPLTGGIDTFGELRTPLCQPCFLSGITEETRELEDTFEYYAQKLQNLYTDLDQAESEGEEETIQLSIEDIETKLYKVERRWIELGYKIADLPMV